MSAEANTPTPEITFTRQDGDAALAVLASVNDPGYALPTLTDEEIVALDGINHKQAVALPWLDTHRDKLELACNVALRTLLSKGLVFPVSVNDETVPSRLGAVEPITGVMALRRLSQRVIIAELTKAENEKVWLYTYIHDETALQELVDSSGIHAFSICRTVDAAGTIMDLRQRGRRRHPRRTCRNPHERPVRGQGGPGVRGRPGRHYCHRHQQCAGSGRSVHALHVQRRLVWHGGLRAGRRSPALCRPGQQDHGPVQGVRRRVRGRCLRAVTETEARSSLPALRTALRSRWPDRERCWERLPWMSWCWLPLPPPPPTS